MPNTTHITATTPFPWAVIRAVTLDDGTLIPALRIVAEDADYAVGGNWYIAGDEAGLTDEQADEACDIASDILSAIADDIDNGIAVPVTE